MSDTAKIDVSKLSDSQLLEISKRAKELEDKNRLEALKANGEVIIPIGEQRAVLDMQRGKARDAKLFAVLRSNPILAEAIGSAAEQPKAAEQPAPKK